MKFFLYLFLGLFFISGCIPVLIGAGLVTGYALSNDSAIGDVKTKYHLLWNRCLDTLESINAEILTTNESRGIIKAKVYASNLTIRINTINSRMQKLKVSVRKYLLPKPQLAQKVFVKIIKAAK